jgi:hypothetical protein
MNKFRGTALVTVALLALTGCSGARKAAVGTPLPSSAVMTAAGTVPTTSPTLNPGPEAYLAWTKTAWLGGTNLSIAGDDIALSMGNNSCEMLAESSFGSTVQFMTTVSSKPSTAEASGLVKQAVMNLCPQHKSLVP